MGGFFSNSGGGGGGTIGGSGTANFIPLFTPDGTTLGNSYIRQSGTTVLVGGVGAYPTNFTVVTDGLAARYGLAHTNGAIELSSYLDDPAGVGAGAFWGTKSNHDFFIYTNDGSAQAIFRTNGNFALPNQTASTVPYFDANKNIVSSAVTPTELGYLSGSESNIQDQINFIQNTINVFNYNNFS